MLQGKERTSSTNRKEQDNANTAQNTEQLKVMNNKFKAKASEKALSVFYFTFCLLCEYAVGCIAKRALAGWERGEGSGRSAAQRLQLLPFY